MADVCVVTIVRGRHEHLGHQLRLLAQSDPDSVHVLVSMDDPDIRTIARRHGGAREIEVVNCAPDPRGLPLASARNVGVARAIVRHCEVVVLLDVDCLVGDQTLARYVQAARAHPHALLCGPVTYLAPDARPPRAAEELQALTDPHPARPAPVPGRAETGDQYHLFWSLSAALTPPTWHELGGFCEEYVGYGAEDTDLGFVARRQQVELVWVGGADAYHQHHPVSSPPVEHLEAIVRNANTFFWRWGQWPMQGWLHAFSDLGLVDVDGRGALVVSTPAAAPTPEAGPA
ncbi:MAG: glycosyltransferase family 2 protein [Ornithinimicrobium sp.]